MTYVIVIPSQAEEFFLGNLGENALGFRFPLEPAEAIPE